MYNGELKKLIIKGVIGFALGFIFTLCYMPEAGALGYCGIGIFTAGLPYGWELSGRIIGGKLVLGHIVIMLFAFVLRFVVAMLVGWVAYPIALVHCIVKFRKNEKVDQ